MSLVASGLFTLICFLTRVDVLRVDLRVRGLFAWLAADLVLRRFVPVADFPAERFLVVFASCVAMLLSLRISLIIAVAFAIGEV